MPRLRAACELLLMFARIRLAALLLLPVFAIQPVAAQIPGLTKSADPAAEAPVDSLGRTTPRGTIVGFSRAVDRGDFRAAAEYLQLDDSQRRNAAALAYDLKTIIDRELRESISQISDQPAGDLEDNLPPDRERVGPLIIREQEAFIELVRVKIEANAQVWVISSRTLSKVPLVAEIVGKTWIERNLPRTLLEYEFLGLSLAHWTVLVGLLAAGFAALTLLGFAVNFVARRLISGGRRLLAWDAWYDATRWPLVAILTILLQVVLIPTLGFPLTFRVNYAHVGLVALVVILAWLLRRSLRLGFSHARNLVYGKDRASTQSLMMLAERMLQALIVVIAIVTLLILFGVESKTALAALGVVGVALALGAQKTVENLLGGIFLLSDKALAVGDYCTIGNQSGTVEDVTLRSVRIRTQQQTLVSLPAGSLAQAGIENFATRRKMMILTTLRLRYGTGVGQLRQILAGIQALLLAHPKIEQDSTYVRLVNFGAEAIELELFAYVQTTEPDEFRAAREALLLEVATLIETAGSALTPTRYVHLMQDGAVS
jgi:MscS family membrane protein